MRRLSAGALLVAGVLLLASGCSTNSPKATVPDYDGRALYATNCSGCHGTYGEGNGPVSPSLALVLQDLRYLSQRNGGEFPREFARDIIDGRALRAAHGPGGMPVWGVVFQRQEGFDQAANARVAAKVDALVAFLESIQQSSEDR